MGIIKVRRPGLMSTIQDLGRIGHQSSGFSPAGVCDFESAALANYLLENEADCAVIEMTMQGMSFDVLKNTVIATAGADMDLFINGELFPVGRALSLKKGDHVKFGVVKEGLRTYLAVPGGFKGTEVLGSVSTHVRSEIGGFKGRALERFDILENHGSDVQAFPYVIKKRERQIIRRIRIMEGPEYERFSEEAKEKLVDEWYVIQNQSDRMGIRLDGEAITTVDGSHDIISAPTQLGNVQVPKNGLPIILLNDRQSSGGYTRIATVCKVDLLKLAQMKPGERFKFEMISIEKAQDLYTKKMNDLKVRQAIYADREHRHYRRVTAERVESLLGGAENE
ncbi:MAG: biotin-dependent carboxyltransferase family protein [Atopococcus tabaci]|uniref:Biotin-dependent carboxyltransferase family protein n=1 Tax=Atopococcus tabaci TaxID=269774 RepID=A0AA43UCV0_9LACT|nr:biotin-dependent carboxyltransferase family protein [Atopococcus tabaci]